MLLFQRWIMEGYSVRQMALQSGHNRMKLRRLNDSFLANPPPTSSLDPGAARYLLFDGTFLDRYHSLAVLMSRQTHQLVRGQFGVREHSEPDLRTFFEPMVAEGLFPRSFTVDGNRHVINVLRSLWPNAAIQRCLVHIQRQGLSWCRISPKTTYARRLREIFLQVTGISTMARKEAFLKLFATWEDRYGAEIAARRKVMSDQLASLNREALPYLKDLDQERLEAICAAVAGWLDMAEESERTLVLEALQVVVRATTHEATIAGVLPLEVPRFVTDGEGLPSDNEYLTGLPFAVSLELTAD